MSEKLSYKDASYHGAGLIKLPIKVVGASPHVVQEDYALISVLDTDRVYRNVKKDIIPQWWVNLTQQSEFVKKSGNQPTIIKLPDDSYMLAGKHVQSFVEWLEELDSDGVSYDRDAKGFIIEKPIWPDDTNKIMSSSGVHTTPLASEYISPTTEQSRRLDEDSELAEKDGFTIPDKKLFPTKRTLMSHQEPVVKVLAWRGKGILADDVGSGKSSMFINGFFSLVQYLVTQEGYHYEDCWPLVIVTKKPLIEPTKRECEVWLNGVTTHVIAGKKSGDIPENTQVILCPLSSLDNQIENILEMNPKGVIFDESHMIKNPQAKRTQAAIVLSEWVKNNNSHPYIVCASATPMPNRPSELWSQIKITGMDKPIVKHMNKRQKFPKRTRFNARKSFTMPVTNQQKFEIRYCEGKPGPFGWEANGSSHEHELAQILRENGLIRRKKSEFITPLPLLYQDFVRCSLNDVEQARYDLAEQKFRDHLVVSLRNKAKKEKWSAEQLREEIADKLMKATNAEAIMKMTELRQLAADIKIPYGVEWIHRFFSGDPAIIGKSKNRKKLIVFAHHKETQKSIIEHPELQQYGVLSIIAGTKNTNEIVDEFQDWNSGKNLIVLNSENREGLTLTAARDLLIMETPFQPSWLIQMAGRCWSRISENYPPHEAHLHYLVSDTNIDKYLEEMIRKKSWLHKAIIDGELATDVINDAESGEHEQEDNTEDIIKAMLKKR